MLPPPLLPDEDLPAALLRSVRDTFESTTLEKEPPYSPATSRRTPLRRRTDREWLEIFIEQINSPLNIRDFCRPRGMSPTSFCAKRLKLIEKYAITDLLSVDLDRIAFRKPYRINGLNHPDHTPIKDIAADLSLAKSKQMIECIFPSFIVKIPAESDPAWAADLVTKLLKVSNGGK